METKRDSYQSAFHPALRHVCLSARGEPKAEPLQFGVPDNCLLPD